jgi:lipid A oxidase
LVEKSPLRIRSRGTYYFQRIGLVRSFSQLCLAILFPLAAFGQWSAAAYTGKTHTQSADVEVVRPPDIHIVFRDVGFDDRSFHKPLYYGLRAGYMLRSWADVEGEFIHIKAFARVNEPVHAAGTLPEVSNTAGKTAPALVVQQYSVSHGLNLLLGNLVVHHPVVRRLNVSFRAGIGLAIPHAEIRAFAQQLQQYQLHGHALQLSGGVEFQLIRRLFWLGEYKFTTTSPRFEITSGSIESSFATHHVLSGLGFRF